jgi:leader peptidase (prepilin peptidase)/N-methyltransferase
MASLIACYVVGLAWFQSLRHKFFDFDDLLIPRMIDVVIVMWLLWIGSSIGSFLNVVAWRMPRGESLNGRSKCPRCETRLKARDNFPVFGWLALRGRCRTCRLPISKRYPIVEAVVGISIAVVGIAELYRLALPYQVNYWQGGPLWTPMIDRPLLLVLLYHVVVLSASWACGLIRLDGHRLPRGLAIFSLVCAIVPMLIYSPLMVVPWQAVAPPSWPPGEQGLSSRIILESAMRVATALTAATILSRVIGQRLFPSADLKMAPLSVETNRLFDLIVMVSLPSLLVGWQAIPATLLMALLLAMLVRRRLPVESEGLAAVAIAIPVATCIQISCWRLTYHIPFWPSAESSPYVFLVAVFALWIASLLSSSVFSQQERPSKASSPPTDLPHENTS